MPTERDPVIVRDVLNHWGTPLGARVLFSFRRAAMRLRVAHAFLDAMVLARRFDLKGKSAFRVEPSKIIMVSHCRATVAPRHSAGGCGARESISSCRAVRHSGARTADGRVRSQAASLSSLQNRRRLIHSGCGNARASSCSHRHSVISDMLP